MPSRSWPRPARRGRDDEHDEETTSQLGFEPGFSTLAIHAGQEPDPLTGAVVTPIHLASTYAQEAVGEHKGFDYSRTRNPTRASLETTMAALEGAAHGVAFASGMAADDAVLRLLRPGRPRHHPRRRLRRHLPARLQPLRRSRRQLHARRPRTTPPPSAAAWRERDPPRVAGDAEQPEAARRRHRGRRRDRGHAHGARCIVDNTFATPYLQQPL